MNNIIKTIKELAEYGALHESDCCCNTEFGCDVGTAELDCCNHMKALKEYSLKLVGEVFEYVSHDIFDNEEQRKMGLKMYMDNLGERIKEENI